MTYDETGVIQTIDTFLYGKDENGDEKTYLIAYDKNRDEKITVWTDGEANADYDSDRGLDLCFGS